MYYKSTLSVAFKFYIWNQSGHLRIAQLFCIVSAPCRTAYIELHFGFIPSACVGGHYTKRQRNRSHSVLSNYEELSFGELEFCINCWKIWVMKVVTTADCNLKPQKEWFSNLGGSCHALMSASASVEYGLFSSLPSKLMWGLLLGIF